MTEEDEPVESRPVQEGARQQEREQDERDPADRAPSWGPESAPDEQDRSEAATPEATQEEWDRVLDEADAPPPQQRDPRDHPDVPESARRMLRDDTSAG